LQKENILRRQRNPLPALIRKTSHFGTVKLLHHRKEEKRSMRIRRVAGLARNRPLMRVDNGNGTGKNTSCTDKLSSVDDRMNMELGSKFS
jgi:hypothetical protein